MHWFGILLSHLCLQFEGLISFMVSHIFYMFCFYVIKIFSIFLTYLIYIPILSLWLEVLSSAWFILLIKFFQFSCCVIRFFHSISFSAWVIFNVFISLYWITFSGTACFITSISIIFVFPWASLRHLSLLLSFFSPCVSLELLESLMKFVIFLLNSVCWFSARKFWLADIPTYLVGLERIHLLYLSYYLEFYSDISARGLIFSVLSLIWREQVGAEERMCRQLGPGSWK